MATIAGDSDTRKRITFGYLCRLAVPVAVADLRVDLILVHRIVFSVEEDYIVVKLIFDLELAEGFHKANRVLKAHRVHPVRLRRSPAHGLVVAVID